MLSTIATCASAKPSYSFAPKLRGCVRGGSVAAAVPCEPRRRRRVPQQALAVWWRPHRFLIEWVVDEVELTQLRQRLQPLDLGPLVDLVVRHDDDLEVDELLDARERRDLVVRNPDLLERIGEVVEAFDLFEVVAPERDDLERVATGRARTA